MQLSLSFTLIAAFCLVATAGFAQVSAKDPKLEISPLVGVWEISMTKDPGKPYAPSYKGRSFVRHGPNAFTLIMEYRPDGSYRRLSRTGANEAVLDGIWKLNAGELKLRRRGAGEDEVMYVRFDNPDQYTVIEVFEGAADPGLFARFKRIK